MQKYGTATKRWIIILGGPDIMHVALRQIFEAKGYGVFLLTKERISAMQVHSTMHEQERRQWIEVEPGVLLMDSHVAAMIVLNLGVFDTSVGQLKSVQALYERSGWLAFWMQYMQQVKYVVNRLSHEMLSPSYFTLLSIYHKMDHVGLHHPSWRYASIDNGSDNQAYVMVDVRGRFFNFKQRATKDCGEHSSALWIQAEQGVWVSYLCVGIDVFAKTYHHNNQYYLPQEEKEKIVELCRMMRLHFAEGLCLQKNGRWIHYGLSAEPDWQKRWRTHWKVMADYCLQLAGKANKAKQLAVVSRCHVKLPQLGH